MMSRRHCRGCPSINGFTLLEVVVALAIFAVAATLALRVIGAVTRSAVISGDYLAAVNIAESRLAQVIAEGPEAVASGWEDDYFHWRVTAEALDTSDGDLATSWRDSDLEPWHYRVVVSWGEGPRHLQMDTVRLVRRP